MKIIENATRYSSLIDLSIITSMIAFIIGYLMRYTWTMEFFQITYIIGSINSSINVLCLYLQYPFANEYYDKYCVGIHRCWRFILTRKATRLLMKRYQKVQEENESVNQYGIQQMTPLKTND